MSGGWLKKRFGAPETMTSDSKFMGATVKEWEKSLFKGFLKIIEVDRNTSSGGSGVEENLRAQPKKK